MKSAVRCRNRRGWRTRLWGRHNRPTIASANYQGRKPHRRCRRTDQHDRRADQSLGAQRHDRGGACRRGRTRLRRSGIRGEGLAEQTAKATGEISQQINGIQAATQESVGAIREIGQTISRMSEIASAIAAAVEEQGAATQEISRNVQLAARGTQQVSANIVDVERSATQTGSSSSQVLSAAKSLSTESSRLQVTVDKFLSNVRAA